MKRILSIILTVLMLVSVLCVAPVSTSAAEVETAQTGATVTSDGTARLYFKMDSVSWWLAGNNGDGNFAYFFNNSTGKNAWSTHAKVYDSASKIFYIEIPSGSWAGVVLTRNNTSTAPSWNNKWNQSGDITLSATSNYISKFSEGSTSVTWGTAIKPASTAGITASATEVETGAEVKLSTALTSNADINTISAVTYSVNSEAATVENDVFTAAEAGEYKVTAEVTYYANCYTSLTSTTTATATITVTDSAEPEVTEPEVTEPEATEPEATEPEATEPEATEPEATEAPEAETMTVYFSNNWRWEGKIYAYAWDAEDTVLGAWPGKGMTKVATNEYGEEIYSIVVPSDIVAIIFNNGSNQTKDIPASALFDGVGVYVTDTEEGFGTYTYVEVPEEPTEEPTEAPTDAPTDAPSEEPSEDPSEDPTEAPEAEVITIFFQNNWKWSDVKIYYWDADNNPVSEVWPGNDMAYYETVGEYDIYSHNIPSNIGGFLINGIKDDGTETLDQTPDITEGFYENICYYMLWEDGNKVGSADISDILYGSEEDPTEEPTDAPVIPDLPSTGDEPTEDPTEEPTDAPVTESMTIYFQNNWNWSDINIYCWDSEYQYINAQWPGSEMAYYDNDGTYDIYSYNLPAGVAGFVINGLKDDGTGTLDQTPDITEGFYDGICYYMLWDNGNKVGFEDLTVILPGSGENEGEGEEPEPEPCEHEFNSTGVCYKCNALDEGVIAGVAGYNLVLTGQIGFNLYVVISDEVAADESAELILTLYSKDEVIKIPVSALEYQQNGTYKVTINMAAKEMADLINLTVKTDTEERNLGNYAIRDYCMNVINGTYASEQLKDLAKSMLNYGAAAQIYFGYMTEDLANAYMSEDDKAVFVYDFSSFAPVIEGEVGDGAIEFYGASLILESDTYLKFYFKVDETKLPEGAIPSITINGLRGARLERNGNLWTIKMPSLAAHELSEEFVLEIGANYTVTYSANSYVYTAQQSGKANLVALANALGVYSYAAGVYASE